MAIKAAIGASKTEAPKSLGLDAIERVKRDATVNLPIPEAPVSEEVPVTQTPLAQSLAGQGFDIQPSTPPPQVAETQAEQQRLAQEDQAWGDALTGAQPPTPLQEVQRERERIKPLSQRAQVIAESTDPAQAMLNRAGNVTAVLDKTRDELPTLPTGFKSKAKFHEGDVEGALGEGLSPSRLLYDPAVLDAAEFDYKNQERINPMVGAIMGMVTENWLRNSGFQDGKEIEGEAFADEEVDAVVSAEPDPESPLAKSKQNARLGDQVWTEWMREKAVLDGLPSDEYVTQRRKPGSEELQAIGAMAKEAYWAGNQDIVDRFDKDGQVYFQIKPDKHQKLVDSYKALSKPFESEEVPPLLNAPAQGQPEFEARTRAKAQTTKTGIKDAGPVIRKAKENLSKMPRLQDKGREKIFFAMAMQGIAEGFQAISSAVQPDPNYVGTGRPPLTFNLDALPPASADSVYAAHYKVGVKRARALVSKKQNAIKTATAELEEERAQPEPKASVIKKLEAELAEAHKLSPAAIYKADTLKLLETLQTTARYSGQVLHGTYATQMLTGRLGMQQNKWDPQGNTALRFVVGGPNKVRLNPRNNGVAERAFKELIVKHFLGTKDSKADLKPHARIEAFNNWKNGRPTIIRGQTFEGVGRREKDGEVVRTPVSYEEAVAAGKALNEWAAGIDATPAQQAVLGVQVDPAAPLGDTLAPLAEAGLGALPDAAVAVVDKVSVKEAPYVVDWLMNLAQFDEGKPFYTSTEGEIDGITHGISSNAMALGLENMALRAGAINPDPSLKLMPLESDGQVSGDLRDAMKAYIEDAAPEIAQTFIDQSDPETLHHLVDIANEAVQDRDNYLKRSPMTLGYGQALESLRQHVRTTMDTGDRFQEIQNIISDNNMDSKQVEDFLHTTLVNSIGQELDARVLRVGEQLKGINMLATMSNHVMYYDNGMNFRSNITSLENLPSDDPNAPKPSKFKLRGRGGKGEMNIETTVFKEAPSGSALRAYDADSDPVPGAWGHGRSIPTMAQTYDGTMISGVATGKSHADMSHMLRSMNYQLSYQPIFDAFKGDLATLGVLREKANEEWVKGIKKNDYVGQLLGPKGWYDETLSNFRKELQEMTEPLVLDETGKWKGFNHIINNKGAASIAKTLAPNEEVAKERGIPLDLDARYGGYLDLTIGVEERAGLKRPFKDGKPAPYPQITPQQALNYLDELMETLKIRQYNHKLARDVDTDRKELFKKLSGTDSLQVDY